MNKKILAVLAAVSGIALQTETMAAQNQGGFTGPSVGHNRRTGQKHE